MVAGEKWGVNIWLYSSASLQNKATLRARAPPKVFAELRKFVVDAGCPRPPSHRRVATHPAQAEPLDPGTYPRDLFKSPQDPTPRNAFALLAEFAAALPPESSGCRHAGAELCLRCCEGYRDGERRFFSYAEFLSAGRCAGVARALQSVAIDHHVAFKIDGVQVGLGAGPAPRFAPRPRSDSSDSD